MRHGRQQVEAQQDFTIEEEAEHLIEEAIATAPTPLSHCPSPLSSISDIPSIHEDEEALKDLLGAEEIPLELGLVFLLPEIQVLYQVHQAVQREVLSHSPAHEVGFTLNTNGQERGNRY